MHVNICLVTIYLSVLGWEIQLRMEVNLGLAIFPDFPRCRFDHICCRHGGAVSG